MDYFVYILQSERDGRFYYGQTQKLQKRIDTHNQGKSSYTKNFIPWELFASKTCASRAEAMSLERKLKNTHDVERMLKFIVKNDFTVVGKLQD